eukprot:Skav214864  [mRNA]  locus=scaffold16:554197:555334:+ [translate_table: standard]
MGNTAFCGNCSEVCREQISEIQCDQPAKDRIYAFRRVFELMDLDGDGRINVDDFVLVGLHQTRLHAHRPLNQQQEEEAYLARTLDSLQLEDMKAERIALHRLVSDATIAHDRIMIDRALRLTRAPRLPTILTSESHRESSLSPKGDSPLKERLVQEAQYSSI